MEFPPVREQSVGGIAGLELFGLEKCPQPRRRMLGQLYWFATADQKVTGELIMNSGKIGAILNQFFIVQQLALQMSQFEFIDLVNAGD